MKTKEEIKTLIKELANSDTTVRKLNGSMKEYIRFSLKEGTIQNPAIVTAIKKALNNACYIDWWSVDVHKSQIL